MKQHTEFPVWRDHLSSAAIGLFVVGLLFYFNIFYTFDSNDFSIFISLLGVIVGFLFTVLTILYAFEENLKGNVAFRELNAKGVYNQIYPIFTDSIAVSFSSLVCLIFLYFFRNLTTMSWFYYFFVFLIASSLIASLLRSYRCLFVFSLLQRVMSKYPSNKK